jgi:hypothetical protein
MGNASTTFNVRQVEATDCNRHCRWLHARRRKRPAEFFAIDHPICYNIRLNLAEDTQKRGGIEKLANSPLILNSF